MRLVGGSIIYAQITQAEETMNEQALKRFKVVFVGTNSCGKTCCITRFIENEFPVDYIPTVVENVVKDIECNGQAVTLEITDTAGGEDYDKLRPLYYSDANGNYNTDLFLLEYSVVTPSTYENVKSYWFPHIQECCPNVPYMVVGLRTDLRDDPATIERLTEKRQTAITPEQGLKLAKEINALAFVECSAKTGQGVQEVFQTAVNLLLDPSFRPLQKHKNCSVQ